MAFAAAGDTNDGEVTREFTIKSPYKDVRWDEWGAYKGNLHAHSTYSDASTSMFDMVNEHYKQGYDFLAMAEHGITGKDWNKKPSFRLVYTYQDIIGAPKGYLTDGQFAGMTSGTYPAVDGGSPRGKGMTCVTGANELNAVVITKSHVNGFFLPEGAGETGFGYENGFKQAVQLVDHSGGLSHINHPGDWLNSSNDIKNASDPESVKLFGNIMLEYDSCLGLEVMNGGNGRTAYDRILWDQLLMYVLPYGRNVFGFSNNDAHTPDAVDSSFSVFMMEENNMANVKKTMQSGAFFAVTRRMRKNDIIGPVADINTSNQNLTYPMFTNIAVDGHSVYVETENADSIQWIANGKVIHTEERLGGAAESVSNGWFTMLDLDAIDGAEDFQYIRAEIFGEGGMCATQAFIIDDGTPAKTYVPDKSFAAKWDNFIFWFKSRYIYVIIQLLIGALS